MDREEKRGRPKSDPLPNVPSQMNKDQTDFESDKEEKDLRKLDIYDLWNQGKSANEIASIVNIKYKSLPQLSRNAVIGLVHRRKEHDEIDNARTITRICVNPNKPRNNRVVKNANGEHMLKRKPVRIVETPKPKENDLENVKPTFSRPKTSLPAVIKTNERTMRNLANVVVPASREFVADRWVELEFKNEYGCCHIHEMKYCNSPCCNGANDRRSSYCVDHYKANNDLHPRKKTVSVKWKTF